MMFSSYLMFVYDPLQFFIKKILSLSPGTIFFYLWSTPPYRACINFHVFNVTNHERFLSGVDKKLSFQEVGPYCFHEIIVNKNITFHDNGTVTYIPLRNLDFRRELSTGDPWEDRVITPNIPLVGISAMIQDSSMLTNIGFNMVSNTANAKPFLNLTVYEYFFGYDDLLVTMANTALPNWINFERFGIFDRIMALDNGSNIVTMTTDPSFKPSNPLYTTQEVSRPYYIQEFNGSPGLPQWGYEDTEGNATSESNSRCNFIGGVYDGTIFPQNLVPEFDFHLYRRAFCRSVPVRFKREFVTDYGFDAMEYVVKDDFLANPSVNPENACYCHNNKCLPNGLVNIAPCYYGIPITLSQPHFYNADPALLEQVDGLHPDKSKHNLEFTLHKQLGVPLTGHLRIQINLDVGETRFNSKTEIFNGLHLPLCWLELNLEEPPSIVVLAAYSLYKVLPVVQEITKFILLILGAAMISSSALWTLHSSTMNENATPLENLQNLSFSRFSLRRSSEYKPLAAISIPQEFIRPELRRMSLK